MKQERISPVDFYRDRVLQSMIRESVALAEASSFGKPATPYAPTSPGAEDCRATTAGFLNRKKGRSKL